MHHLHQPGFADHHVQQQGAHGPAVASGPGLLLQPQLAHHRGADHLLRLSPGAFLQQPQQVAAAVLDHHRPHLVFDATANRAGQGFVWLPAGQCVEHGAQGHGRNRGQALVLEVQQQRQGLEVRASHCRVAGEAAEQGIEPDLHRLAAAIKQQPAVLGGALLALGHEGGAGGLGAVLGGLDFGLLPRCLVDVLRRWNSCRMLARCRKGLFRRFFHYTSATLARPY